MAKDLKHYIHHPAFYPSFATALLYLTVLSFGGQLITYLLSVGWSSFNIGLARTVSVTFEMIATCVAPLVMQKLGPIRSGIWSINWQTLSLVAGVSVFWWGKSSMVATSGLVVGTVVSRIGLWVFDLATQTIIQRVCPDFRHTSKHTTCTVD